MDFTSYQAEATRFRPARKGLDPDEVKRFQARASRSLRAYERELAAATERITVLERALSDRKSPGVDHADGIPSEDPAGPADVLLESARTEASLVLRSAFEEHAAVTARIAAADNRAAAILEGAAARAAELVATAELEAGDRAGRMVAAAENRAAVTGATARARAREELTASAVAHRTGEEQRHELARAGRAVALCVVAGARAEAEATLEAAALQASAAEDEAGRRVAVANALAADEARSLEQRLDGLRKVIRETEERFRAVAAASLDDLAGVSRADDSVVIELEGTDVVVDLTGAGAEPHGDALHDRRAAQMVTVEDLPSVAVASGDDAATPPPMTSRDPDDLRRRPGFYQRRLAGLRERIDRYED